ncbi:hypothetical protein HD806DRAFT_546929 [Xylariaceae sp. AK1471]|nr:hypothetical protein HD806DRAFT_546929 [Xylariaceae sp. AK1471]
MPRTAKPRVTDDINTDSTDNKLHARDGDGPEPDTRINELRLWPPPCMQAYCLDHFLMECEIYHEHENERYNKLVAHSRGTFLAKQKKPSKPAPNPTRRQPSRRAKDEHSVLEVTMKPQRPPRPKKPSSAPFKPLRLEKAFTDSQEGVMYRILSVLREKLELHGSWEDYESALGGEIHETANRLRAEIEKGRRAHEKCIFGDPLRIECRYCGLAAAVEDDGEITPRKLAAPAAMHEIQPTEYREGGVKFRGIEFFVDVCGDKTMIILGLFKGVLDICTELFEGEAVPESPTSLSAHLISNNAKEIGDVASKRHLEDPESERERKRRKEGKGSSVREEARVPDADE